MKRNYCLISHTHWDREWYIPFENFRMRLVDLTDHLLDILEADPGYRFHLDAQTIVLEDYLAIRPHRRHDLEKHIRAGRLLVGPWYVQNDFHLTGGEATVRNLLIGTAIAESFGGSMPVGYAADQFGLISQLPQILTGFGLDTCVFGRGFSRSTTEFFWESEDGSRILCEHMRFWYNNAQRLSDDPAVSLALLRARGDQCEKFAIGSNLLMMNGVDHLEAQEDLTEILKKMQPLLGENEAVFQDTLPEFMERLCREIEENGLAVETHRGEFRDGGRETVLTGTLSSRVYLKQENVRAQAMLEKRLEPLYALLAAGGVKAYPADWFRYLWKLLIENHPHDSICGCSADAVHRHMTDRFARLGENTEDLFARAVDVLNDHIEGEYAPDDYRLFLINTTQFSEHRSVPALVEIGTDDDRGAFEILSESGDRIPFAVESVQMNYGTRILSPINLPGERRVNRYRIRLAPGCVDGMSYRVLTVKPQAGETEAVQKETNPSLMESDALSVRIRPNGTVDLTNKATGRTYENLLLMEDAADYGDSYRHLPVPAVPVITSAGADARITSVLENEYVSIREIRYGLSVEREVSSGVIGITVRLTLEKSSDELHAEVTVDNPVTHHRLRTRIPTGFRTDSNYAGQPFDCIVRPKISEQPNDWDHPNTDYVGIEDGREGIAILQEGLYEYEHMTDENGTLALTLLRSTGIITGNHAVEDTMTESWKAPECFCLGRYTLRFALVPYAGDRTEAGIAARAQRFLCPVTAVCRPADYKKTVGGRPFVQAAGMPDLFYRPVENPECRLPVTMSFLKLESNPANAMILSAVKMAEDGSGLTVRLYNSVSAPVRFTLGCGFPVSAAEKLMLCEKKIADLPLNAAGEAEYTAAPKEIVTLKFVI